MKKCSPLNFTSTHFYDNSREFTYPSRITGSRDKTVHDSLTYLKHKKLHCENDKLIRNGKL